MSVDAASYATESTSKCQSAKLPSCCLIKV